MRSRKDKRIEWLWNNGFKPNEQWRSYDLAHVAVTDAFILMAPWWHWFKLVLWIKISKFLGMIK